MLDCAELIPVQPAEIVSQTFSSFEFEHADYWQEWEFNYYSERGLHFVFWGQAWAIWGLPI